MMQINWQKLVFLGFPARRWHSQIFPERWSAKGPATVPGT